VNEAPVLSSTDKVALNNEPSINALVGDGGFETTLHGPWTLVTNDSGDDQIVTGHAHSGTHSMEFGQVSGSATLTQSVSTTSGASYQLSFWVEDSDGNGSETFSASWNGVTLQSLTHATGPASYTQYTFNVTGGSGASTSLKFAGNNASGFWYLDDVTLTPASAPAPTGTLVSSLVGLGSGPGNVTDVDTGAKTGIAITAADTSNGSWLYSTDGVHWLAFGAVSGTNALLLAADSSTSVSFQPNPGFTGTATLTFEAWDQSSGSNGTFANASVTGGSSAFSSSTETASVTVGVPSSSPFTLQTTTDTVFYTGSTTHVVTGTNTTLGTADNLNGDGADTLNLNLSGDSSAYTFSFAAMTGSFVGFSTLALSAAPGNTVNLTFGNNNILSGQTMTVDAHLSTKGFTANALGVTDGGNFVFVAANDALNTLTGGSGNDTFDFLSANLVSTEAVNGEAGTNTLFLTDATGLSVSDTAFTGVQNIETLKVGGSGTDSLTLGSHASSMAGGAGHTLTIDDTTGTGPLTILGSAMTANMTVELTSAHFTSSDSITGGSGTDTIQLVDTGGVTVAGSAFTSVHSVEILKIGGSGPDSVTLGSAASADVGGAGHTFTVDDTAGTGTLTLNASAMTANLVVELQSAEFTSSDTITGGSGSDTIQLVDTTGIVVADAAFVHVTSVETLKIGGTADDAVTLGSNASADVGGLGHLFTLDDSAALGNLYVNAAAMVANLEVLAGAGADTIVGGSGSDTFLAGIGNDIFTGGLGSNTYVFNSLNLGADQITNFNNSSRADQIQVSATGFGGQLAANEDVTSVFQTASNANFSGAGGGKGQFLFDTANHTLYYSADGATAAAHAIAQIEAGVTLTPHDIHVAA
jgi:Ca2+-binding RTX toxin-like protein